MYKRRFKTPRFQRQQSGRLVARERGSAVGGRGGGGGCCHRRGYRCLAQVQRRRAPVQCGCPAARGICGGRRVLGRVGDRSEEGGRCCGEEAHAGLCCLCCCCCYCCR